MRTALAVIAAGIVCAGLAGCSGGGGGGGGGGSGGGDTPVSYTGNTNPAAISESNAALLAAAATNSAGTAEITGVVSSAASGSEPQQGEGITDVGRRIAHRVRTLSVKARAEARLTSVPFDQTFACDNPGGTVRLFGDINQFGIGTISFTFTNCVSGGDSLTGTLTMRVDRTLVGPGPNDILPTDFTLSFARLSLRGSVNLDTGGTIHDVVDVPTNKETITENRVALNLDTGRMIKAEVTSVNTYANVTAVTLNLLTHSINGRVFDSIHGFVNIETLAELRFATATQLFPGGGEVILTGANNRRIQVVPNSTTRVTLGLDLDGNGTFERLVRLGWTDLTGPIGSDLRDTDGDGMHNSWEAAFAGAVNANLFDRDANPDNDEFSNSAEYMGGGNPGVPGSKPELMVAAPVPVVSDFSGGFNSLISGESAIASDGTNFLIVSCRTAAGASPGAFGVFVSETGRVGTNFPISSDAVCPQRPALAFDGTNYLVVVTLGDQLVGFGVTPAGVVSAGKPITSSNDGTSNSLPSIAFDGTNYLVAWRNLSGSVPSSIRAALVNKSGDLVGTEFMIPNPGNPLVPMVAFGGANYLVVWSGGSSAIEDVFGARVSTAGVVLDSPAIPIATSSNSSQLVGGVASDGTNYLVVWDDTTSGSVPPTNGSIRGRRVVAADGSLLDGTADTAGIAISTSSTVANHSSSVAFAGSTFVVTWGIGRNNSMFSPAGIFAARVSKAGERIDGAPGDLGVTVGFSTFSSVSLHPIIATKGQSQSALISWLSVPDSGSLNDILVSPVISP
jgi:hypothetical protein